MKQIFRSAWALLAAAAPAAAQCAMCRTALSHKNGDTFNRAILILLVPALVMFGTIFLAVVRFAGNSRQEDPDPKPEE